MLEVPKSAYTVKYTDNYRNTGGKIENHDEL